jgi:sialate O-acetylesterase
VTSLSFIPHDIPLLHAWRQSFFKIFSEICEGLLTALIHDWQRQWGECDMEFLVVQLPGYSTPRLYSERSTWALLREAQMQATAETGQPPAICTIDCGDPVNLHPINKEPVGKRLAMAAEGK